MTKAPTQTEKSKKQRDNTKTPPKLRLHRIADRLRTVSWSNDSYSTGVVKTVYGIQTFQLTMDATWDSGEDYKFNIYYILVYLFACNHGKINELIEKFKSLKSSSLKS